MADTTNTTDAMERRCMKMFSPDAYDFHYTQWDRTTDVYDGWDTKTKNPVYISCYQQHLGDGIVNHCCYSDDPANILYACRDCHTGCVERILPLVKQDNLRTALRFAVYGGHKLIIDMVIQRIKSYSGV